MPQGVSVFDTKQILWLAGCQAPHSGILCILSCPIVSCTISVAGSVTIDMSATLQLIMLLTLVGGTLGQANNTDKDCRQVFGSILAQLEGGLELHLRSYSDADLGIVQFVLKQPRNSVQIKVNSEEENEKEEFTAMRHHFFLFKDVKDMQQSRNNLINTDGFYILSLENQLPEDDQILKDFMSQNWLQHGHSRIYYIQLSTGRILLYNPFQQSIVWVKDPKTYGQIYQNLNGYPLRIYIFDSVYSAVLGDGENKKVLSVTGADAKLAKTVAKQLNFTADYLWPDDEFFGGRLPDGSFSGGVGRAHRGEVDIIFAGFFVKDYLTTQMQFSAAVYMDDLCLYVQKAQRIPQSILPLFAVHTDVWLCFLLVGLLGALVWLLLRLLNLRLNIERIQDDGVSRDSYLRTAARRIFIDTWVVWVRVNIGRFPPFHSERIFVASLCLVSVIFGALLESSLATVYIRPLYYRDTNTMRELDESGLPIYIKHPAFKDDLFYGSDSAVYRRLDSKMMLVAEGEERLIEMVSKRGHFAGVTRSASLELSDIRYVMTKKVHKIPECPKSYHIAYVLPRPSPYLEEVNRIVLRLVAAGIVGLWTGETKERAKWSIQRFPEYLAQLDVGRWKVLTLSDVQLAFYALSIGCILAGIVCLAEIFLRRKRRKLRRNNNLNLGHKFAFYD
ncbi:uncharacterized protein Ir100a [Drosophila kikkawai]|uniref:Uncharacterized protein Ir100a n=1 Tax=Drosophila kikkawai TaxID=30033 RepID=A0A6P4IUC0_DROKI|nr:uncharacterized protein LOC108077567 [Drosophila kikkawai]